VTLGQNWRTKAAVEEPTFVLVSAICFQAF